MNRNLSFINFADDEEKRVVSRALELAQRSRDSKTRVSSFLNLREQKLISAALTSDGSFCFTFYGGFGDAERRVLICFPEYVAYSMLLEPGYIDPSDIEIEKLCLESITDDIKLICVSTSQFASLTHRDYMGAILSLGIERSSVGDILPINEHEAYIFVTTKIAEFLIQNLTSVGKAPVKVKTCTLGEKIALKRNTVSSQVVVTSLRLDCVISAITGLAREKSKQMISRGLTELNCYSKASPDDAVVCGDVISVRGYGKYKISDTNGTTAKGKIRITVLKYT